VTGTDGPSARDDRRPPAPPSDDGAALDPVEEWRGPLTRIPVAISAILVVFAVVGAVAIGSQLRQIAAPIVAGGPTPSIGGQAPSSRPSVPVQPSPTPDPSVAASSPSPGPFPDASSTPDIPIDSIATVVTNDLRVRSRPEVSDTSELLTPLLQKGRRVFIVDGPVAGSGYDWYQVKPLQDPNPEGLGDLREDLPFGWVAAAGKDGEGWLAGTTFQCPPRPTMDSAGLLGLVGLAALSCLGDSLVTVRALLIARDGGCPPGDPPIEPAWLNNYTCDISLFSIRSMTLEDAIADFDVAMPLSERLPSVGNSADSPDTYDAEITGHFDDPAAQTCRAVGEVARSVEEVVLDCRATFVITAIRGIPRS
jgi:hypothetical protein